MFPIIFDFGCLRKEESGVGLEWEVVLRMEKEDGVMIDCGLLKKQGEA